MHVRYLAALVALPLLTAATLPRDAPEHAADASDKVICKKFIRTGSLVDGYRICKTKADWQRDRDNARSLGTGGACNVADTPDPNKPGSGACPV
ncbi:hypothetical protein Q4F19_00810 [Sphingomonas sp. BIUV-7]|uniref:YARHG domain-containing protein n=1 Tax=Sphingomonas natans TaxID=3063330 RepID=A0ABT8Y3M4_9SPHN|nr:hypothetical protein [Sphingomonas sp. BIUV-7]MDO6412912.1 hypothetical protein [Sphingomonas sp. BIUV-7]